MIHCLRHARSFAPLACLIAVGLAPSTAAAAACCMSATSVGVGRLLNWEAAAIGVRQTHTESVGLWTDEGRWREFGETYTDHEHRLEWWALLRLNRRSSFSLRFPYLWNVRSAEGMETEWGGGAGEVQAGLRWEAAMIGERRHVPGIAVTAGFLAPLGRSADEAEAPFAVDATTRGGCAVAGGLSVERTVAPWFIRLDAGTSVPLPYERADTGETQRFGTRAELGLAVGYEVVTDFVASIQIHGGWEGLLHTGGVAIPDSARADTGVGASLSWRPLPHWTLQASVDSGVLRDDFGDNQQGRISESFGVRYGVFR